MSKDLTSKMHVKIKLFTHKLQEGGSVMNHLSIFKEIVADLVSMEVKYDDEDLALLLLCSLPTSFANFRDTTLLSRDELTFAEVYEVLQTREKMKGMVQSDVSSSKGEVLQVRGRPEQKTYNNNNNRDKSKNGKGRSKSRGRDKFCRYCKKDTMSLRIVGSCRIRRKETVRINRKTNPMVMVRPLLSPLLIFLIQETFWLFLLVVMNGYLILHAHFIYALTEIDSGDVLTKEGRSL